MKYYEIFHRYATVAGCTLRTHFSLTDYTIFLVSENKNERVIAHILYVSTSLDYAYNVFRDIDYEQNVGATCRRECVLLTGTLTRHYLYKASCCSALKLLFAIWIIEIADKLLLSFFIST